MRHVILATMTTPLKIALQKLGDEIRHNKYETMFILDSITGEVRKRIDSKNDPVSIKDVPMFMLKGGVALHNHPDGHTFSVGDFSTLFNHWLEQAVIVTVEEFYILTGNPRLRTATSTAAKVIDEYTRWEESMQCMKMVSSQKQILRINLVAKLSTRLGATFEIRKTLNSGKLNPNVENNRHENNRSHQTKVYCSIQE